MQKNEWSIIDIIQWGSGYFAEKGIDSPRLTIELLLCDVLDMQRIQLYSDFDKPLSKSELALIKSYVKRCIKNEPVQYITGKAFFMGMQLTINNSVLIPRPETEILVNQIITEVDKTNHLNILDIGTGSGCIAIYIASKLPKAHITALDISEDALAVARENASKYKLNNIEFVKMDIIKMYPDKNYDIVVSNPPYISMSEYEILDCCVKEHEPRYALTEEGDGLLFYRRYAEIFPSILNEGGRFYLEIAYNQSDDINEIFAKKGYKLNTIKDLSGIQRILTNRI